MRSIRNCPKCGSNRPLMRRYFNKPLVSISDLSDDKKFVVEADIDVCMNCNTVYATRWETTHRDEAKSKTVENKPGKQDNIAQTGKKDVKKEVVQENKQKDAVKTDEDGKGAK